MNVCMFVCTHVLRIRVYVGMYAYICMYVCVFNVNIYV